jgi:hypothetical protein
VALEGSSIISDTDPGAEGGACQCAVSVMQAASPRRGTGSLGLTRNEEKVACFGSLHIRERCEPRDPLLDIGEGVDGGGPVTRLPGTRALHPSLWRRVWP